MTLLVRHTRQCRLLVFSASVGALRPSPRAGLPSRPPSPRGRQPGPGCLPGRAPWCAPRSLRSDRRPALQGGGERRRLNRRFPSAQQLPGRGVARRPSRGQQGRDGVHRLTARWLRERRDAFGSVVLGVLDSGRTTRVPDAAVGSSRPWVAMRAADRARTGKRLRRTLDVWPIRSASRSAWPACPAGSAARLPRTPPPQWASRPGPGEAAPARPAGIKRESASPVLLIVWAVMAIVRKLLRDRR